MRSNGHKPDYELCDVVCGENGWGRCQKPAGHPGKIHDPAVLRSLGPDAHVPGWSDDPRPEQDAIYREVSS